MARDFPHLLQPHLQLVVAAVRNVREASPMSIERLRIELATRQQNVGRLCMASARRLEQAVVPFELNVRVGAQLKELEQDCWPDPWTSGPFAAVWSAVQPAMRPRGTGADNA